MKIKLQTTYENANPEFIEWYCEFLKKNPMLIKVAEDLKIHGKAVLVSEMQDGIKVCTRYEIERNENETT